MNKKKIILIAVAVVAVAGISIRLFGGSTAKHKVTYETATVIKGEISESITATGTIEPVTEVEVGTQVSGIIDKIYACLLYTSISAETTPPPKTEKKMIKKSRI